MNRSILFKLLMLAAGVAILAGLLARLGVAEVGVALKGAKPAWILAGLVVYSCSLYLRSWKWQRLLIALGHRVGHRTALAAFVTNQALGNLTPGRSGEMAAPLILQRHARAPLGSGLAVLMVDRFLELSFLLLLMALALVYFLTIGTLPTAVVGPGIAVLSLLVAALVMLGLALYARRLVVLGLSALDKACGRAPLGALSRAVPRVQREADGFYAALDTYKSSGVLRLAIALTALAWLFELGSFFLLVNSVGQVPFLLVAASQVMSFGAGLASFVPNGIGVTALSFVYLVSLRGYPGASAAAGALLGTVVNFGLVIVLAMVFALSHPSPRASEQAPVPGEKM